MGKFCIPGRLRASACFRAKERLMRVILGKKTNKHMKTVAELPENEKNLKRWAPDLEAWEIIVQNIKRKLSSSSPRNKTSLTRKGW